MPISKIVSQEVEATQNENKGSQEIGLVGDMECLLGKAFGSHQFTLMIRVARSSSDERDQGVEEVGRNVK